MFATVILLGILVFSPPVEKPKTEVEELRAEVARLLKVISNNHNEINDLREQLRSAEADDEERGNKVSTLKFENAQLREKLDHFKEKNNNADALDLFKQFKGRGPLWCGTVVRREDNPSGVGVVLSNRIGKIVVVVSAELRAGERLERLTVDRNLAVKGEVARMIYSPAGFFDPEKLEIVLSNATIERGPD